MANDKAHLTAITRRVPSMPCFELKMHDKLIGRVLDYGCGRGIDHKYYGLNAKYDPFWAPAKPKGKFDTILCTYVANVVLPEDEFKLLNDIRSYLTDDGIAYISVRRDIKKEGYTKKGTYQRNVTLDLPVFKERKGSYCIYELTSSGEWA